MRSRLRAETTSCRSAQQPACSCSYPVQPAWSSRRSQQQRHVLASGNLPGRRPARAAVTHAPLPATTQGSRRAAGVVCASGDDVISGYTPANYISFSEDAAHIAPHSFSTIVNAPASICFNIWNDWNRLVEFLDLVAQIGLDPNNPDLALFQTFYRHGLLPVMEIVFVLQKTEVVKDQSIAFESVWGMPMTGAVTFTPLDDGRTEVELAFAQSLPDILVDLKVGVFGVQNSLRPIFADNLAAFKALAEEAAADTSGALPPRPEAGEQAYPLFDEYLDTEMFEQAMDELQRREQAEEEYEQEEDYGQRQQQGPGQASGVQQGPGTAAPAAVTAAQPGLRAEPGVSSTSSGQRAGGTAAAAGAAAGDGRSTQAATGRSPASGRGAAEPAYRGTQQQQQGPGDQAAGRKRSARTRGAA